MLVELNSPRRQIAEDYDIKWKLDDEPGNHKHTEKELDRKEAEESTENSKKKKQEEDK
jgi:hypothetical protein